MAKNEDDGTKPVWLKRMENGAIAEARTKAFLMDRFWILERSVDIQGADFIIQRRITSKNLLDNNPPRLGVIQVKFIQDENTRQSVHQEYVCTREGTPRKEFFLIIHNGNEEHKRAFLLSSEEIVTHFKTEEHSDTVKYIIPGRSILPDSRFEILSDVHALDRIEQSLRIADFTNNRKFLSWICRLMQSLPLRTLTVNIYSRSTIGTETFKTSFTGQRRAYKVYSSI